MSPNLWLEQVARGMLRAGLPLWYVERTAEELTAHLEDARLDQPDGAEQFVGSVSPHRLTSQLVRGYRIGKWYRRLPTIAWLPFPIVVCIGVCLTWYSTGLLLLEGFFSSLSSPDASHSLLIWFYYAGKLTTPVVATFVLLCALNAAAVGKRLRVINVALLAFMFLVTMTEMSVPTSAGNGHFLLTIDTEQMTLFQPVQALAVIVVCGWEAIRRRRRRDQLTSRLSGPATTY